MKLGTETASVINQILSSPSAVTPEVGMGATIIGWTDRAAATICRIYTNQKTVVVRRDNATRVDNNGMSDAQQWACSPNPSAAEEFFTLRKNGQWVRSGSRNGERLLIGVRKHYYDFSF